MPTSSENSSTTSSRSLLGTVSLSLLGVVVFIFILLISGVVLVRSSWGSAHVLTYAQGFLKTKMNTEFQFSEGRIDFLSGFHFKNLKIVKNDEGTQASIEIPEIDLAYSISIFKRRLEILDFTLSHARIAVKHRSAALVEKDAPSQASSESPRDKLEKFILDPPAEVVVDRVSIDDLDLDADLDGPGAQKKIQLQNLNLHFKMEMVQERLAASGDISMSPRNLLSTATKNTPAAVPNPAIESRLQVYFAAGGQWSLDIHREGRGWLYRLETNGLKLSLADLQMHQRTGSQTSVLQMASADFNFESNSLLHSAKLLTIDRSSVETMNVTLNGKTSEIQLVSHVTPAAPADELRAGPQKLLFHTLLSKDLDFEFTLNSDRVYKAPTLSRPVALHIQAKGAIPRTLDHVALDSQIDLAGAHLLTSNLEAGLHDQIVSFSGHGDLTVEKAHVSAIPALAKFRAGLKMAFELNGSRGGDGLANDLLEAKFKASAPHLVMAPIPRESNLVVDGQGKWQSAKKIFNFDGDLLFNNAVYGSWKITPQLTADISGNPKLKGETDVAQLVKPLPSGPPLILHQPMHAHYDVDLNSKNGFAKFVVDLPAAEIPGKARLDGTEATVNITSPDLKAANEIKIDFDLKQAAMKLDPTLSNKLPPNSPPMRDLKANAHLEVTGKRHFVLERFKFSMNHEEIAVDTQASGDIADKTLQAQTTLSVQMRDDFPDVNGQRLRGRVKIPVTINVLHGQKISLAGEIELADLSWQKGDHSASGINGKIPFSEKLKWDGQHVRFESLVTQNPFERVDFERVRPLLQSTERLKIDRIGWLEKSFGPFIGFFSLNQNMISAHQFDMDLVSGKLYGEMFIDTYPASLQFGLLARMTGLDLGEILPKKFLNRVPTGSKLISGRAGFVLNLNRSTMDGRIDITEIGGPQLITAINVVDPLFEDEKMNKMRQVLEVGYPTAVQISFAEGYMNMDVGLSILGVNDHEGVHGVRISGLLAKSTTGFLKTAEEGPLK